MPAVEQDPGRADERGRHRFNDDMWRRDYHGTTVGPRDRTSTLTPRSMPPN